VKTFWGNKKKASNCAMIMNNPESNNGSIGGQKKKEMK
jgi:hypothetical protein